MVEDLNSDGEVIYYCDNCDDYFFTPIECKRHEEICKTLHEEPE